MDLNLSLLEKQICSNDLGISIEAADKLLDYSEKIADIILVGLEATNDPLLFTDRISMLFYSYLTQLNSNLNSSNKELAFWSASLICHYGIKNIDAEEILLNAIKSKDYEKATTATRILVRVKNDKVKDAILKLLAGESLEPNLKILFNEAMNRLG